jgi:thioesterase domain-containing protein/acyl carrier protein
VDVNALPLPEQEADAVPAGFIPTTELEQQVRDVWSGLLDMASFGRDANFFDLGGHSLKAIQIAAALEKRLAVDGVLRKLMQNPVFDDFCRALTVQTTGVPSYADIVPLAQSGAGRDAIFVVHCGRGGLDFMAELSATLGADFDLYGVKPALVDVFPDTIPAIASAYLARIRTLRPDGPYRLLSYSSGGLIAHEVARQLQAAGESVLFLGLIDTFIPARDTATPRAGIIERLARQLVRHGGGEEASTSIPADTDGLIDMACAANLMPTGATRAQARTYLSLLETLTQAYADYDPPCTDCGLHLFTSSVAQRAIKDPTLDWAASHGTLVTAHEIGGNHASIVQPPHAAALAAAISETLQSTRTSP